MSPSDKLNRINHLSGSPVHKPFELSVTGQPFMPATFGPICCGAG